MSLEEKYVKDFYNSTAREFSETRYRPWTCVERFLDDVEGNSLIGDIGCGNGKNMDYRDDCEFYGCDFSNGLVKICNEKNLNVINGNVLDIPFKGDMFNNTLCIAVIHHLSDIEKRKKAVKELVRVTKKGGKILILVWAFEQEKNSKRKFLEQENFVDWKDKNQNLLGKRYYYVFKKNELESLLPENTKIIKSFYEKGNWGVIIEKNY
jgi:SAM-dependent methyltransferase